MSRTRGGIAAGRPGRGGDARADLGQPAGDSRTARSSGDAAYCAKAYFGSCVRNVLTSALFGPFGSAFR